MQRRNLRAFFAGLLLTLAVGCTFLQSINPFENAHDVPLKAFASYGTYTIAVEAAGLLKQTGSVSPNLIERLQELEKQAGPYADALYDVAVEVVTLRAQVRAGAAPPERLAEKAAELDARLAEAEPLIDKFYAATYGG